ncbi:CHC2 zinc finger domain-containing protein [Gluconacetobacter sp. Hr-1-5]|uniref:CHC2 zinc finger domain-containing protein n=1 Tax=Gluconacetobacter sp. Hr-1-5 TaxID=3395370 RepID=UPI003B5160B1
MALTAKSNQNEVARLVERADIASVATQLGLQVDGRKQQPRRAICPFHDDKDPSLNLYWGSVNRTERDHYHCFVCGAHGDVISLIQNYEKLSFWDAVKRLADMEGVQFSTRTRPPIDRATGSSMLQQRLNHSSRDDNIFNTFAQNREFDPAFLRERGAAVYSLQGLIEEARSNRLLEEQLVEAGIVRRQDGGQQTADLYGATLRGFFHGKRVVFPIEGANGEIAGFAARSLDELKPKYLYSYDFPRKTSLYGEGRLLAWVREQRTQNIRNPIDIFLVEGIFDVLRLEKLGFHALGILGAQLTPGQIERIERIIALISECDRDLRIHIFLDSDEAGKRGTYDATLRLLRLLQDGPPFRLDIVTPKTTNDAKIDPDAFLNNASREAADSALSQSSWGPLTFLAAYRLGEDPANLDWSTVNRLRLASIARSIAFALANADWDHIIALLTLDENDVGLQQFAALVSGYGGRQPRSKEAAQNLQPFRDLSDDRADLLTALTLGRSSTSRREYPLDDDAWEWLAVGASPLFHVHRARLEVADGPSSPLLTRQIPKGDGRYRLKSGPVSHDALLQQYGLVELLRDRDECPLFADSIPAVRYARDHGSEPSIYRTGNGEKRPSHSFAYQIDMAIVNGLAPPKREGIFRPYFECWRSFVDFLDERIKQFRHDEIQILRLDITGFYDHIRYDAFENALAKPLERALHSLAAADGDIGSFAPLLAPYARHDAADRAEIFTRFLMSHSFGQKYFHPITGEVTASDTRRGIPQGPDLSAYLANISLFDLDEMMEAEISRLDTIDAAEAAGGEARRCAAAYARYVDDVVIICRDIGTASQLRRKVESFIALKGLTLNRKNVIPPPMTRAEARAWITDNRAGFGFSGPLADLPNTEAMDPLADAGEIDRRTALGLIFDPELDNPQNASTCLAKIGVALGAEDIRFNDRASAYRRLWCLAADMLDDIKGTTLASAFFDLVLQSEPRMRHSGDDTERLDIWLAAVEGLDRALRSSIPPSVFDDDVCDRINKNATKLAAGALNNVFGKLATDFCGAAGAQDVLDRYDVRCQIGIIACLAAQKLGGTNADFRFSYLDAILQPSAGGAVALLPDGLRMSLLKFDRSFDTSMPSLLVSRRQSAGAAFSRLNRTLVKLQRVAAFGEAEEPAPFAAADVVEPNTVINLSETILGIWSSGTASGVDRPATDVELDAASTLVNVTYKTFVDVAARRPRLMHLIAGSVDAVALPSPPGLKASGILLKCSDDRLLLASAGEEAYTPVGILWIDKDDQPIAGIKLREAALPRGSTLLAEGQPFREPSQIAALYRAAYPIFMDQLRANIESVPVPTAFSFFASRVGNDIDLSTLKLICWLAPRSSVDGHAFVRVGTALEARSVFSDGADLWRFGWAVRDVCNRAELVLDEENGIDQHATTVLEQHFHRREAIITRVLPRLSGADRWGPGEGTPENPIPTRITRALLLLENFDRTKTVSGAASYLVAAVSEGMFMSERVNALEDLSSPGQPAALMARSARRASRALPEAAKHWPVLKPASLPYRRSAAAWQTLSEMIRQSATSVVSSAADSLHALEVGTEILAALTDLRALAFELVAALPDESIDLLGDADFELGWISDIVGLDLVMLDTGVPTTDPSLAAQTKRVVQTFRKIILDQRGGLNHLRDQIMPSGWVVLVAILVQIVPISQRWTIFRPELWQIDAANMAEAETALRTLLKFYASPSHSTGNAPNWPWDVFDELILQRPDDLPALLRQLTTATRIRVSTEVSWTNPRTGESQADRPIMRLADGSNLSLAEWQIDIAYVRGERGTAMESRQLRGRMRFPYSVTRRGDQVIGMHLVSQKLAQAAFGRDPENAASTDRDSDQTISLPETQPAAMPKTQPETLLTLDASTQREATDPALTPAPSALIDVGMSAVEDALAVIANKRDRSWKSRAEGKTAGAHRVALVQWDVTDSYYSPGHKDGLYEGLVTAAGDAAAPASSVRGGGVFLSTSENRRRALIKEVLSACVKFKVDGLIFPEYSLRPETINWLARQLQSSAWPITVWCGTFRVPGGTQIDLDFTPTATMPYASAALAQPQPGFSRWDYHSALLTCLRATTDPRSGLRVESFVRQKRYPSAAAGELIRPPIDQPWTPLLDDKHPFSLGTFSLELVCSEMFPHASSANFIGIVEENNELAARYGLKKGGESMLEHVSKDVYEFAKWTAYRNGTEISESLKKALYRGQALQRTLIVLPAMTNRSADYHVFGQNQYLAAGLVTAFCNAVAPHVGCGQSGFIGLDGWKQTEGVHTPYGSKAPGIFQLGGSHSGALGETETAMIIADLDLLRTADQRPRPHYQRRSLRLVAHLPIFFATEKGDKLGKGAYPNRRRQLRIRNVNGSAQSFFAATELIAKALSIESDWRSAMNVADRTSIISNDYSAAIATTNEALKILEEFADDKMWLRKRTESFMAERYDFPPMEPLPALIDWLYVDDRWLPDDKAVGGPDANEDPLKSDRPVLGVPRSMQNEPTKKAH